MSREYNRRAEAKGGEESRSTIDSECDSIQPTVWEHKKAPGNNPDSPPFFTSQSPPGYFSAAMEEVEYGRNASLLHGGSDSAPSLWSDAMRGGPSPTALQDTAALTAFSAEDHHARSSSLPLPSTGATSSWPQVHGDFLMALDNGAAALEMRDDEDQNAHPILPPTLSMARHSFPVIVVDCASDPLLTSDLSDLSAPILHHFCKDLGTLTWNTMFHEPIARLPTSAACWKLITRACDHELTFDPDWEPEEVLLQSTKLVYMGRRIERSETIAVSMFTDENFRDILSNQISLTCERFRVHIWTTVNNVIFTSSGSPDQGIIPTPELFTLGHLRDLRNMVKFSDEFGYSILHVMDHSGNLSRVVRWFGNEVVCTIVKRMLFDMQYSEWLAVLHSTVTENGFPAWTSLPFASPYGLAFLIAHIVFALKQFIRRMDKKRLPVDTYQKQKNYLSDDDRVSIQKITNDLELTFQRATLGIPGKTREERHDIRRGYRNWASRGSQFPYRSCPFGLDSLRTNPLERLHIG